MTSPSPVCKLVHEDALSSVAAVEAAARRRQYSGSKLRKPDNNIGKRHFAMILDAYLKCV
jgi:hypothetical protein